MRRSAALLQLAAAAAAGAAPGSKPHIVSILQDDLGWYDSGVHSTEAAEWSGNITALAKEGVVLTNHYTHWHCSPTRRSFLTGRLPIHHGEQLSGDSSDDIDLRQTWISQKLKRAGYRTHWFGKMHTGFRSYNHLGHNKGFDSNVGSLQTGGTYSGPTHSTRWQDEHPIWADSQFSGRPAGCGLVAAPQPAGAAAACNTSILNDTKMACGEALRFLDASAAECCAACSADPECTHWVHNPGDTAHKACHIKGGDSACSGEEKGVVSGRKASPAGGAACTNEYSTDLWGQLALQAVGDHDPAVPLYLHLCFQAVHTPYDKAPGDPTGNVYRGMLWRADVYIGQLVAALKSKGMWERTLVVYSADNGGVEAGNNYPLRGEKHSNWEGGLRAAAFVSGGLLPAAVRGTNNSVNMHIVDWYPTFCVLAGVDASDNPPVAPLPTDPADPHRNIYGDHSYPPLDGVNVWDILTNPAVHPAPDAAHANLVLSKEVIISGRYKLLVSQPHFKSQNCGWKHRDGQSWEPSSDKDWDCNLQDLPPSESALPVPAAGRRPCLFDVHADASERVNLAAQNPDIVARLWAALNATVLTQRDCSGWTYKPIPGPNGSCSPPELLGNCSAQSQACAKAKWQAYGNKDGPICGVPGC
eukprot:TRINITY_DN222_c0_g1_i1.p1 TRINITY_DN222_c0_g1~~TRINITY_DN222_c0_g1_i1.p1  ORF type:complete len:641 (+),score=182.67 TRINITY_DN222_c0_g1_i1:72-1994(+)